MHCERVQELLDIYLSQGLTPREESRLEEHLQGCEACREALERLRRLAAVLEDDPVPPVPAGLAARILAEARGRDSRRQPAIQASWSPRRWWQSVSVPMRTAAVGTLAAGLLMGGFMGWTVRYRPSGLAMANQSQVAHSAAAEYNLDYLAEAPAGSLVRAYLDLTVANN